MVRLSLVSGPIVVRLCWDYSLFSPGAHGVPMGFPWGSRQCPPVLSCFSVLLFFCKFSKNKWEYITMSPQWLAGAPGLMGVMGYPGPGLLGPRGPRARALGYPGARAQGPGPAYGSRRAYGLPGAASMRPPPPACDAPGAPLGPCFFHAIY